MGRLGLSMSFGLMNSMDCEFPSEVTKASGQSQRSNSYRRIDHVLPSPKAMPVILTTGPRRRADRTTIGFCAVHESGSGPKLTSRTDARDVCY
jgi:hypothetical protein